MGGVFAVTAVELAFAEVHGGNNRHYHHRSDLVDGPVRHPDGTLTPEKDVSDSLENEQAKEVETKAFMQCMLLEMGILFHSVFIGGPTCFINPATTNLCESTGMALSVSRGQSFIVLFIAIVFHRTYPLLARLGFSWSSFFSAHVMAYSQFILCSRVRPTRGSRR